MHADKINMMHEILKFRAANGLTTDPSRFFWLWNSSVHQHVMFLRDKYERVSGYMAWANFSKESLLQTISTGRVSINIDDWSEGRFLVLVDVAAARSGPVNFSEILRGLPKRKYIMFLRRNRLYVLKRGQGLRPILKIATAFGEAKPQAVTR